jgi:hypothetical protein
VVHRARGAAVAAEPAAQALLLVAQQVGRLRQEPPVQGRGVVDAAPAAGKPLSQVCRSSDPLQMEIFWLRGIP